VELKSSQFKINHLNDTPSTKAAGGGIYSGVFDKDVKVPDQSKSRGGACWYQSKIIRGTNYYKRYNFFYICYSSVHLG
jgi:hypothetical protein